MYIPECCLCVYVRVSIAALQYNCEFYAYLPTNPPKNGWKHFFFFRDTLRISFGIPAEPRGNENPKEKSC